MKLQSHDPGRLGVGALLNGSFHGVQTMKKLQERQNQLWERIAQSMDQPVPPLSRQITYSQVNCVPNAFSQAVILVLAGTAGAGGLRMAPPTSARISARLKRVGSTVHP